MKHAFGLPQGYTRPLQILTKLKHEPESYWVKRGEQRVLKLFHQMARRVPAYKDFLKNHSVDPDKIKTIKDFKSVPTIDKNNYLRVYPRDALCWDGIFDGKQWVIATTSGSTGEPFYFPRQSTQDVYYAITAEHFLLTNFNIDKKSTLFIIGFPMGIWIGGIFTYTILKMIANSNNYKLSIATPGINKLEILKAVKNLGSHFDQIIIGSYAPFLKDTLDDGKQMGIEWEKHHMGFVFAAEGFSETFRDYVIKTTGTTNPYMQTLNIYGTVDLGTMAHETPLSILIRRMAVKNSKLFEFLFGQVTKLPTLTQFNPEMFYFEEVMGNLICSSPSGLPLVRYDLKDHGGILSYASLMQKMVDFGIDSEIQEAGIDHTIYQLPLVYVYERSDFSVSFFAFQIYPETIRKALQGKELEGSITGKFTMLVSYDAHGNQQFEINVELKSGVNESNALKKHIQLACVRYLLSENSEYRKTHDEYATRIYPKIKLWLYEDPTYFKPGVKQKWVKK